VRSVSPADTPAVTSGRHSDTFVLTHVYRPLAGALVHALSRTSLTPNQISGVSFLLMLAAAAALATGRGYLVVAGAVLVQVAFVLDCVDGQLARFTGRTSRFGTVFDTILDRYADLALIVGLVGAAQWTTFAWASAFAATVSTLVVRDLSRMYPDAPPRWVRRTERIVLFCVGAVCLVPDWTLLAVGVLGTADAVRSHVVVLTSAWRDLQGQQAQGGGSGDQG